MWPEAGAKVIEIHDVQSFDTLVTGNRAFMIRIYHNTRCTKSRCALDLLTRQNQPFEVVEYLKNPPSEAELVQLLQLLGKRPEAIVRKKEALFQEKFLGKNFSDSEWISILAANPILIERPIVVAGDRAWIARDEDSLDEIGRLLHTS